jgi:predicted RNA methylase
VTPDQIAEIAARNWHRRQAQITRLAPRQVTAAAKREELRQRAEACDGKERDAETMFKLKRHTCFFPTPAGLADQLIGMAKIYDGARVLEPSIGKGDLATRARAAGGVVHGVEIVHELAEMSQALGFHVRRGDFLLQRPSDYDQPFDRVVANPPFDHGSALRHVLHAFEFLAVGGSLVAIVDNMTAHRLREWADGVIKLPPGSFAASERPTLVNTAIIQKHK